MANQLKICTRLSRQHLANGGTLVYILLAMILLGIHLNHGFQSAFQSVGLRHKKYTPTIKMLGTAFSISITIGFISFPIYFFIIQL